MQADILRQQHAAGLQSREDMLPARRHGSGHWQSVRRERRATQRPGRSRCEPGSPVLRRPRWRWRPHGLPVRWWWQPEHRPQRLRWRELQAEARPAGRLHLPR
jgi:hypothetical protein